ncbi:MAG: oligoendopeptidase F [Eubacteriales bacterium]|nr:oligoendopeptidase F [Eubacteriales bacterium]
MPKRQEIDNQYKWAVNDLYSSDEKWELDYEKALRLAEEPCIYKDRMSESEEIFYSALRESEDTDFLIENVYVYAFMKYYEDTTNPKYQEISGRAQTVMVKLSEKYSFMVPEILAMDKEIIDSFLKNPKISHYRHMLMDILAKKEHSLSQKEEALLAKAGNMSDVAKDVFSKFNNSDVKFGVIKDEQGREVELSHGNYAVFMESNDRQVRKDAFEALYRQYEKYANTLAAAYYGNVKQAMFFAEARNFGSTLEMYLSGSFIPVDVYKNLIETVNKNLGFMHEYVSLRKKELGVEKLHFYDIYAPMVKDVKMEIPYENAKEIVLDALKPFGADYVNQVRKGYESGWVDVYENTGKRNGAFSWGAYGTHPYIFLNYTGTLNDVFTLIHETGHAMHTWYSNNNQDYTYAGYRIFVAEVASTCNEAVLIKYMLDRCTDSRERKYLINHYLEQFKGTLFRQTMFAEFEMETHRLAEEGRILNAELLNDVYRKLNEKYFGADMVIDEKIALEWSRIPHFYTPFYVYQYATGFSAAIAIAARIINKDEETLAGYKKFLAGGSSLHPIELLKLCGIDMSKPQVIQDALDIFAQLVRSWE